MALDVEKMEVKLGVHSSFLYHHLLLLALQVGLPLFSLTCIDLVQGWLHRQTLPARACRRPSEAVQTATASSA